MKNSLRKKFIVPVFAVAALGLFILSFTCYYESKQLLNKYIQGNAEDKVEKLVDGMNNELEQWKLIVQLFSDNELISKSKYKEFFHYVKENHIVCKNFTLILVSDLNGNYIDDSGNKGSIKDRSYFKSAVNGDIVISDPIISKNRGTPVIAIASPIKRNGEIKGVLSVNISLSHLTDVINVERMGEKGYAFMLDSQGRPMAYPKKEHILKENMLNSSNEKLREIANNMVSGISGVGKYDYEEGSKIIAYRPVKYVPWSIAMTANYDELSQDIRVLRRFTIFISVCVISTILIALYYLLKSVISPIEEMQECMKVASDGDLSVQCNVKRSDELGDLGHSLNVLIRENKQLLDETIEYDRLKVEFFSNISHELKTPLNVIFSTIQLLNLYVKENRINFKDYNINEEVLDSTKIIKYIDIMGQNTQRLIRLTNNLIDITCIDSASLELNLSNENIVEVVENLTLATVEYMNKIGRNIIFDTDVEEKIIAIDKDKIERILLNLFSNAIKSTEKGDYISVDIIDRGSDVCIRVKDTGEGIEEQKQKVIFERFRQVDELYIRKHEGTGIGLSIVKSLVDMHHGDIILKSEPGCGSEFIISLPSRIVDKEYKEEKIVRESLKEKIEIEFSDIYS
ncbi:ATP-binding protein [Hathewaya histolytica]|uniref:sensor histidine kinase n=1 Tax=Hathewaya histolytica TaxID=1498 RepID=UPI003B6709C5